MKLKRQEEPFNISFLDVMACGLGAAIMLLILVKFNDDSKIPTHETDRLQEELAAQEDKQTQLQKSIEKINDAIGMESSTIKSINFQMLELEIEQDATRKALNTKVAVVANLEKSIAAAAPKNAEDDIRLDGGGEENYILGLKVEGRQIGILIDKSASMMDESLIKVLRYISDSASIRRSTPKWNRTKRIAKWLIARLPKKSKVSVVAFSDKAEVLGNRNILSAKFTESMKSLVSDVNKLTPENGTNLQVGLETISKAMPNMTDLYIITDGLPTLGEQDGSLSSIVGCSSFLGSSKTISGECRLKLFNHTLERSAPKGVTTNIILLPLEGDPMSAQAYWQWSVATGGLMISPSGNWP